MSHSWTIVDFYTQIIENEVSDSGSFVRADMSFSEYSFILAAPFRSGGKKSVYNKICKNNI